MKYGIHPSGNVREAYGFLFETLEDATKSASYLSDKYKIDVLVFEVLGTYKNRTTWEGSDIEGKDNG